MADICMAFYKYFPKLLHQSLHQSLKDALRVLLFRKFRMVK